MNESEKKYHSALSQCAELLDNMNDGDPITDVPHFLAAKLKQTHMAGAARQGGITSEENGAGALTKTTLTGEQLHQFYVDARGGVDEGLIAVANAAIAAHLARQAQTEPGQSILVPAWVYRSARDLAVSIWRENYSGTAPNWEPLDDLAGVISQIDNMVTGMSRIEPAKAPAKWSKEAPTEQGDYWHWTGDDDHAPMIYHVMWSGTAKKCFLSIGQYDITSAIWCDEFGGHWMKIEQPSTRAEVAPASAQNAEAIRNAATDEEIHQRVRDAVAGALTGLYYCDRVWSAWSVGTMSEDDFSPADEDDDIIENVTSAAIRALQSGTATSKTAEPFSNEESDELAAYGINATNLVKIGELPKQSACAYERDDGSNCECGWPKKTCRNYAAAEKGQQNG